MTQLHTLQTPKNSLQQILLQMFSGYWVSQAIYVAAKLGVADCLQAEAKHCDELAVLVGADARALYRLMRALASLGIFAEEESGSFKLTPLAACLQSQAPNSARALVIMRGEEPYRAWGDLLYSVKTNASAFEQIYGMNLFQYHAANPEPAKLFDEAMTSLSSIESAAVLERYDFSAFHKLVDVAGGQGYLIAAILNAYPKLEGVLFDQDPVIARARFILEAAGILDRCQLVGGDFLEEAPAGGDAYLLKHILHDWDDQRAIAILRNCRQAMVDNGRILIVEHIIPPGNTPFFGKLYDLHMLVLCPGGRERTVVEYQSLLELAGFRLTGITPTTSYVSVIEGVKA